MLVLFMLKILFTCFTVRSTFTEIRLKEEAKHLPVTTLQVNVSFVFYLIRTTNSPITIAKNAAPSTSAAAKIIEARISFTASG